MLPMLSRRGLPESMDWVDREFGRMLRRYWGEDGDTIPTAVYPVNIWEDDDSLHVEAELPGFTSDQVDVTLEQGMLTISAERKQEHAEGGNGQRSPILHERRFTRYHRSFSLPTAVDEENIQAKMHDGVLHLSLPKRAEVKPRKIKVSA